MAMNNQITKRTTIGVEEYNGGFAVVSTTYETVVHARTGVKETTIVPGSVRRLSKVRGDRRLAAKDLLYIQQDPQFSSFKLAN